MRLMGYCPTQHTQLGYCSTQSNMNVWNGLDMPNNCRILTITMRDIKEYQAEYGLGWINIWKKDKSMEEASKTKWKWVKGKKKPRKYWNEYDFYRHDVDTLTNLNKHNVINIHTRGFQTYHLEHKISCKFGYDNNIPAKHIADISNLEMMWWKDNVLKSTSCKIDASNHWIVDNML